MALLIKASLPGRCIFAVMATLFVLSGVAVAGEKNRSLVNCNIQNGVCTRAINGRTVTLEVLPRPVKAMQELMFQVTLAGHPGKEHPYIDLNMPAMNMGKNRVMLKPDGQGTYEGRGVIVRCRSGRRTWSAKVTFPGVGATEFIFDVIY